MKHVWYKCPQPCEKPNCMFCEGGLASCVVCKCGEGTLPTDCPGEPVSALRQEFIMQRLIDFKDGKWKKK